MRRRFVSGQSRRGCTGSAPYRRSHIDATGAHALSQRAASLRDEGITFLVARLEEPMRWTFAHDGLLAAIGEHNLYPTVRAAVEATTSGGARKRDLT